ncbi:hemerythrin domain-containing protein [Ferrovibrio sp.]|uniref:hemerythrin domain-containing protein n=1 Tax=Ferrovibrio sp. TaxID=1917215 RepID=UPI00311FD039
MGQRIPTEGSPAAASPALLRICTVLAQQDDAASPFDMLEGQRMILLSVCALLDTLPDAGPQLQQPLASAIAGYLRSDFPAMIAEEEEGLLPRLRERLLLGDDLDQVLRQLEEEHRRDRRQAALLAAECDSLADGLMPDEVPALFAALHAFAEQQRRHLAWEAATLLPLARNRLTPADLSGWARAMRARRLLQQ